MSVEKIKLDIDDVEKEAKKELREERMKEAKTQIKAKLQALDKAEQIVANLKRELEELKHEIASGL